MKLSYIPIIPILTYVFKRNENVCPPQDLRANVYNSSIHNYPNLETTQRFIN